MIARNVTTERLMPFFNYSLMVLVISLPLSETVKQVAIIFMILFGCWWFFNKPKIDYDIIDKSLFLFLASNLISAYFAKYYYESIAVDYDFDRELHALYGLFRVAIIFWLIRYAPIKNDIIKKIINLTLLSFLVSFVGAEIMILFKVKEYLELKGVGHVNHSSIYSAIIVVVGVVYFFSKYKKLYLLSIVCSVVGVFQSGSRATIYSLLALLVIYFVMEKFNIKKIIIICCCLLIVFFSVSYFNPHTILKVKKGFSSKSRIFIWKVTINEFKNNNIAFGIGPNNTHYVNPNKYGNIVKWKNLGHPHNTYLSILLENGIVGLFFYMLFIISVLYKQYFNNEGSKTEQMIGFNVSILNILNSIGTTTFNSSSNTIIIMILFAFSLRKNQLTQ